MKYVILSSASQPYLHFTWWADSASAALVDMRYAHKFTHRFLLKIIIVSVVSVRRTWGQLGWLGWRGRVDAPTEGIKHLRLPFLTFLQGDAHVHGRLLCKRCIQVLSKFFLQNLHCQQIFSHLQKFIT